MIKFLENMFVNTLKGWYLLITAGIMLYLWVLWKKRIGKRLKKREDQGKEEIKKFKFRRYKHGRKYI
jgi:hypothetical protein